MVVVVDAVVVAGCRGCSGCGCCGSVGISNVVCGMHPFHRKNPVFFSYMQARIVDILAFVCILPVWYAPLCQR